MAPTPSAPAWPAGCSRPCWRSSAVPPAAMGSSARSSSKSATLRCVGGRARGPEGRVPPGWQPREAGLLSCLGFAASNTTEGADAPSQSPLEAGAVRDSCGLGAGGGVLRALWQDGGAHPCVGASPQLVTALRPFMATVPPCPPAAAASPRGVHPCKPLGAQELPLRGPPEHVGTRAASSPHVPHFLLERLISPSSMRCFVPCFLLPHVHVYTGFLFLGSFSVY